jgi:hypothetical protein
MFTFGGGFNTSSLPALASAVAQALSGIAGQAQTKWSKQHDVNGAHTNVTAAIAVAELFKANGRINIGAPLHLRRPLEADTQPFYLGAGERGAAAAMATFIRIQTSSLDPSPFYWHGLDAAGREEGDVIFLLNVGNEVIEFVADSALAPLDTRFAGNSTAASTNIELHTASLGIAVYSHDTFLGSKYWHLLVLM